MVAAKDGEGGVITVEPATSVRTALSTITAHDIGQRHLPAVGGEAAAQVLAVDPLLRPPRLIQILQNQRSGARRTAGRPSHRPAR